MGVLWGSYVSHSYGICVKTTPPQWANTGGQAQIKESTDIGQLKVFLGLSFVFHSRFLVFLGVFLVFPSVFLVFLVVFLLFLSVFCVSLSLYFMFLNVFRVVLSF